MAIWIVEGARKGRGGRGGAGQALGLENRTLVGQIGKGIIGEGDHAKS